MTYLLDTNAISDLMRSEPCIERWMAALEPHDRIVTCAIVRGEVLFGIAKLAQGQRRSELEPRPTPSCLPFIANQFWNVLVTTTQPSSDLAS